MVAVDALSIGNGKYLKNRQTYKICYCRCLFIFIWIKKYSCVNFGQKCRHIQQCFQWTYVDFLTLNALNPIFVLKLATFLLQKNRYVLLYLNDSYIVLAEQSYKSRVVQEEMGYSQSKGELLLVKRPKAALAHSCCCVIAATLRTNWN